MQIQSFDFPNGKIIRNYHIVDFLGKGWEGEVYLIKEISTGIDRIVKFFYPKRNVRGRASKYYAKKMHKLRNCGIIIQYHTQGTISFKGQPITYLISEFIEGEKLSDFVNKQPGKRLQPFMALHFLHSLAKGMDCIHMMGEYHGDLHQGNIILQRHGLGFDLKLIDLHHLGATKPEHIRDDVIDMIKVFYEVLGGVQHYSKLPVEIKDICCGLKSSLIFKKFRTAGQLKQYIENMEW